MTFYFSEQPSKKPVNVKGEFEGGQRSFGEVGNRPKQPSPDLPSTGVKNVSPGTPKPTLSKYRMTEVGVWSYGVAFCPHGFS